MKISPRTWEPGGQWSRVVLEAQALHLDAVWLEQGPQLSDSHMSPL